MCHAVRVCMRPAVVVKQNAIGCYGDDSVDRALDGYLSTYQFGMTVELCAATARSLGKYARQE